MNYKITVFAVLFSVALSGCGGSSSTNPANTDTINGVAVPPEPDKTKNSATIKGIDANNDGIRDDVERKLAKEFGNSKKHSQSKKLAKSEQTLIMSPTKENVDLYVKNSLCDSLDGKDLKKITNATLTTEERRLIYSNIMSGVLIGGDLCQ